MKTAPLFPTSVVGSLPRPDYVKDLINNTVAHSPEEHRRLMGLAVTSAVAMQEAAGLAIVQIGDPHLCLFVDAGVRSQYPDPDRAADFAVAMTNEVVEGIRGVKLAVHLCRRAGARARSEARSQGGYGPILPQLNRLKVHHLTMEFTAPEAGDMEVFSKLREDLEIGLGCVSTQPGQVDAVEDIVGRVEKALKYLAPE